MSSRQEFEGALIRIGDGFGCLHPWPELGDPGLGDLLDELASNSLESGLAKQAVSMAAIDEKWRQKASAMIEPDSPVPPSHATLPDCTMETVQEAVRCGYEVIKIKGKRAYAELAGRMDEVSRRWPHLRWRVDFNEVLTMEDTLCFVQCLTDHVWKRMDFIEDPCPYDHRVWKELKEITGLSFAVDQAVNVKRCIPEADVLILKPARYVATKFPFKQRIAVTSNMEHPLGQCYAAWNALNLKNLDLNIDVCGLQTHGLFEPTEFSERLGPSRPKFKAPGGTGLGFDDLLEKLPWKLLK